MLKIFNELKPFFEDCYRRINVREYATVLKISPPTASTILSDYHAEDLLKKEEYKQYILFSAQKDNKLFIDLSRSYWNNRLREMVLYLERELVNPTIVLFGSLAKAEVTPLSDIDLAVFAPKRTLLLDHFEKKLKRKIQLFMFTSPQTIKNKELAQNILNGYLLRGRFSL